MIVNICGIEHEVKEYTDHFNGDLHLGQIDYGKYDPPNLEGRSTTTPNIID